MEFCISASKHSAKCGIQARSDAKIYRESDRFSGLGLIKTVLLDYEISSK